MFLLIIKGLDYEFDRIQEEELQLVGLVNSSEF